MSRIVVVGAGMAGLAAAQLLRDRHEVVVLDKSRGVGGRMATRRIGNATLDHGAQFITTHSTEFAAMVRTWAVDGFVEQWFDGQVGPHGVVDTDGHTRFRGAPTMNEIARHLADGLDVRRSSTVRSLSTDGHGWRVSLDDDALVADAVLITAPVPQSLSLLAAGEVALHVDDLAALQCVAYDPCIALLAVLDGPAGLPEPGAVRRADGPIDWMADNQRKGVSTVPAVTIHTTAAFSRTHWDSPDDLIARTLLASAALESAVRRDLTQVHRWRYARPSVLHDAPMLAARGLPPLLFAGDAFEGAKVEGAALSGRRAAEHLLLTL